MNRTLLIAALAAFVAAAPVIAAEDKITAPAESEQKTDNSEKKAEEKQAERHDHGSFKQGASVAKPDPEAKPKKPLHDHQKFHK